ncbi:E3 ubiquitin-protein ligase FANCL [Acrasis kona]|uniref:E3 ubiquitin-protein ligase FANCL n=1 Tax=Acrasis kona TaxID=1008807 RepID=A0AAW2Z215_9EUKA
MSSSDFLPLCVPRNKELTRFHGYITLWNQQYACEVDFNFQEKDGDKPTTKIRLDPELQRLLSTKQIQHQYNSTNQQSTYQDLLVQRLSQCKNYNSFFSELKDVLEKILKVQHTHKQPTVQDDLASTEYYKQIMSDLDEIGWDKVSDLNTDLSSISVSIKDIAGREHIIKVDVSKNNEYTCTAQLPIQAELKTKNNERITLKKIKIEYEHVLHSLQDFLSTVEDLDQNTWVLDPENPTFAHCMRRIGIGNHSSIQIEIDPKQPKAPPEVRFLGADSIITPIRDAYNQNHHEWVIDSSLRLNLERTMKITFPRRRTVTQNDDDMSEKCSICYSYRMEGKVPDKVCDTCCQPFHSMCLVEWLRSIPKSHTSFDTISGTCPYCSSAISAKVYNK